MSNSIYEIHIEGKNGEKVINTYDSLDAVLSDKALTKLEPGQMINGTFQFIPDANKHAYFYVKSIVNGKETFIFQNWGSGVSHHSAPAPPAPAVFSKDNQTPAPACAESVPASPMAPPPPMPINDEVLRAELKQDALIAESGGELLIKEGKLYFNGELLGDSYYRKYKQLLEKNGVRFDLCFSYHVSDAN